MKEGEFLNSTHCLFESAKLFENLENADSKTQNSAQNPKSANFNTPKTAENSKLKIQNSAQTPENSAPQKVAYKVITTQKALDFQRKLFAECAPQSAAILKQAECAILKDDSEIDEIFQQILSTIEQADKGEQIVLDITHGFRHQPIIASFASVLGGINAQKSVQIIYAKAADNKNSGIANADSNNADFTNTDGKNSYGTNADGKNSATTNTDGDDNAHAKNDTPKAHFCYVSLQKYAQISLISLALNSFLKTLTLPELPINPKKALLRRLEELCAALHANAINSRILDEALSALAEAKKSQTFSGLDNILDKIEQLLGRMRQILSQPKECEKFRDFAEFMFEKGFYLIAATYISEGLGHFMLEKFKNAGLLKNANAELYDKIQAAKDLVYCLCTPNKQARKETKDCLKVEQARQRLTQTRKMGDFQRMKSAMADISSLRNALVHLSLKQQNVAAVRVKLLTILNTFKGFFSQNFLQGF